MILIYTHIPKAAGTTLNTIIERNYPPEAIHTVDNRSGTAAHNLKNLPSEQKNRFRIIKGHCPFGLHEALSDGARYFTLVREPAARIVSHYHYVLRTPHHYLHNDVVGSRMTLPQYAASGMSHELDNGQVRMLSGCGRAVPVGNCSAALLDQARKNLKTHYVVAGLAEAFDETLLLLRQAFQWEHIHYTKQNVTDNGEAPASEVLETIRSINSLDWELYQFAKSEFEKTLAAQPESFARELAQFRIENSLFTSK